MGNQLTTPQLIGAVVGSILGAALIAVFISCIVFINKKLIWKTNTRSKIIQSGGQIIGDKWVIDDTKAPPDDRGRQEEIFMPPPPIKVPPPPRKMAPPAHVPELLPQPLPKPIEPLPRPVIPRTPPSPRTPPRLKRYKMRSWPKREPERPIIEHQGSIGHAGGTNYFIYGMPYPVPSVSPYNSAAHVHHVPPVYPPPPPSPPVPPPPPLPLAPPRRCHQRPPEWTPNIPAIPSSHSSSRDDWQLEEQEVFVGDFASEYGGGLTINMDGMTINNDLEDYII